MLFAFIVLISFYTGQLINQCLQLNLPQSNRNTITPVKRETVINDEHQSLPDLVNGGAVSNSLFTTVGCCSQRTITHLEHYEESGFT